MLPRSSLSPMEEAANKYGAVAVDIPSIVPSPSAETTKSFNQTNSSNYQTFLPENIPATLCAFTDETRAAAWKYAKKAALVLVSSATTIPTSVYSFAFPSDRQPSDISAFWWDNMTAGTQFLSVANALINLAVGTLIRYQYFPKSIEKIKEIWKEGCQSPGQGLMRALVLTLSLAAAVSAGALAYDAFIFGGLGVALCGAISNVLVTICFRVVSMTALLQKVVNYFDEDKQLQKECVELLEAFAKAEPEEFERIFGNRAWDEVTLRESMLNFFTEISAMNINPREKTTLEHVKHYSGSAFDVTLGAAWGIAFSLFFAQKGYDGVKIACNLFDENCTIDQIPYMAKLAISFVPGISSTAFGYIAGSEFRELILKLYEHIKEHPMDLLTTFLIAASCGIGATSLTSAAKAILVNDNLFGLDSENIVGVLFVALNTMMAFGFDFTALVNLLVLKEKENNEMSQVKTSSELIQFLKKQDLPPETSKALRSHSFFSERYPKQVKREEYTDLEKGSVLAYAQ